MNVNSRKTQGTTLVRQFRAWMTLHKALSSMRRAAAMVIAGLIS